MPVVALRRSPNLRDLLVTAKLSSNSSNPQYPTCPYISYGLTTTSLTDLLHIRVFLPGKRTR